MKDPENEFMNEIKNEILKSYKMFQEENESVACCLDEHYIL